MRTLLSFVLISALFFPLGTHAGALEDATVNIYCHIKLGGRSINTTGSGVFVDDSGIILTNAHVGHYFLLTDGKGKSKASCKVRTGSPAKDQYEAKLLYISPAWLAAYMQSVNGKEESTGSGYQDFALLYATKSKKGPLPSSFPALAGSFAPAQGAPVSITGYPAEKLEYKEVRDNLLRLSAQSEIDSVRSFDRPFKEILVLAPSQAGQGGISGGPVTDQEDNLLGIVSTLSGKKEKGLKGLRAITLSHIDRTLRGTLGLSWTDVLAKQPGEFSQTALAALPSDIRAALETTLRRLR